ncbi:flagellar assembly protein FliW [Nocardioides okcheonensis]|uniref:flagellar assembly protein FliW n=1 Tax=Nocardioides okcheonensis TaxID=2894081 RepID=UPI001E290EB9|nr:flagellar assembly protein FliW [Nocardioides okcheonensis]UFN43171.1 flagellar assembly protein FliW [Nocardioides okcheonensis]
MIATMDTTTTVTSDVPEIPVIELVQPMPGFPDLARFALVQVDDDGVLCSLTSLDRPGVRFLVVPPMPFFPDYAPEVDESVLTDLGSTSVDDLVVLCVLTAGESLASTTANLAAPVVLDTSTHRALQVVLDDPGLSVATPLIA